MNEEELMNDIWKNTHHFMMELANGEKLDLIETKIYKELLKKYVESEKARKEASNILKDYIPDEYIRSCDTSDGIGRYELDTESWQYKIYEILDIDKGE